VQTDPARYISIHPPLSLQVTATATNNKLAGSHCTRDPKRQRTRHDKPRAAHPRNPDPVRKRDGNGTARFHARTHTKTQSKRNNPDGTYASSREREEVHEQQCHPLLLPRNTKSYTMHERHHNCYQLYRTYEVLYLLATQLLDPFTRRSNSRKERRRHR